MLHKVELIGRLGRDVEGKFTPQGKFVASFPVASNVGYGDNKRTIWTRVTAWEKTGEACNNFLKKGSLVYVAGTLIPDPETGGPRVFTRNDRTTGASFELSATEVKF